MRNFFAVFVKNAWWVYTVIILCFGYRLALEKIPEQIYVTQEELEDGTAQEYLESCKILGVIPVREVAVDVCDRKKVYPGGKIIGIYSHTKGVLVISTSTLENDKRELVTPAMDLVLPGDYILSVNGSPINSKDELIDWVANYHMWNSGRSSAVQDALTLGIQRDDDLIDVRVPLTRTSDGGYKLGIWVKDDLAGIGTMTYISPEGEFGALGHGIGDGQTGELLHISEGEIYEAELVGIQKGSKGAPGELEGVITYSKNHHLGHLNENCNVGITGQLDEEKTEEFLQECNATKVYEVAHKQEVEQGSAYILSDVTGKMETYEVQVTAVDYMSSNSNKGIRLSVSDPKLIAQTGGIVQGMSGSPIIQNGRIIGAVTHVLVSDPTMGYGTFIEEMIK